MPFSCKSKSVYKYAANMLANTTVVKIETRPSYNNGSRISLLVSLQGISGNRNCVVVCDARNTKYITLFLQIGILYYLIFLKKRKKINPFENPLQSLSELLPLII